MFSVELAQDIISKFVKEAQNPQGSPVINGNIHNVRFGGTRNQFVIALEQFPEEMLTAIEKHVDEAGNITLKEILSTMISPFNKKTIADMLCEQYISAWVEGDGSVEKADLIMKFLTSNPTYLAHMEKLGEFNFDLVVDRRQFGRLKVVAELIDVAFDKMYDHAFGIVKALSSDDDAIEILRTRNDTDTISEEFCFLSTFTLPDDPREMEVYDYEIALTRSLSPKLEVAQSIDL